MASPILIQVPPTSEAVNRQSAFAKALKERSVDGEVMKGDTLATLAKKVKAISKFNRGNLNIIARKLDDRIIVGYNYAIKCSLKNNLDQDAQTVEIERVPVRDTVSGCINAWEYKGDELETPEDFFNDHIDYTMKKYPDVLRLNEALAKVAQKYGDSLPDKPISREMIKPFLENMKKIKTAVLELKTVTKEFDDEDVVFNMKTDMKQMMNGLQKLSDELPSTGMEIEAADYVGYNSMPCDRVTKRSLTKISKKASLTGHSSWIRETLYFEQEKKAFMASCSDDCTIKIWNLTDNEVVATLEAHDSYIFALVKFDLNGTPCLASGSNDQTIKVWNLKTQQLIMTLSGHTSYVRSLVGYHLDGKDYLVSASADNTLKIWKPATQSCVNTLEGHESYVLTLAKYTNADGVPCVASGGYDAKIKLWNLAEQKCTTTLVGHNNYIWKLVAFETESGPFLASGCADGTIKMWNLTTNTFTATMMGHTGLVYGLTEFTKKGKTFLVSGDSKGTIKFWDPNNFELANSYQGTFTAVNSLAVFYRKSKPYLTIGHCQNIELWS